MLSILIPTYNYDITTLVENLYQQLENSKLKYELLVCDDCSTNQSIVKNNTHINNLQNCKFIQNQTNLGRTATRQKLANTAQYNLLLFMDADVEVNRDFIKKFNVKNQTADIIFGGTAYLEKKPQKNKVLNWKYGKNREVKSVKDRQKNLYLSIISRCFLIKKEVFLKVNSYLQNGYGFDVVFTNKLKKINTTVKHINNPVIHIGLDDNKSFLKKTKKGLDTLYYFEKQKIIPNDYKSIQKAYQLLKTNHLNSIFISIINSFEKLILINLNSKNPSLFLFDLYRLKYLAVLHLEKTIK